MTITASNYNKSVTRLTYPTKGYTSYIDYMMSLSNCKLAILEYCNNLADYTDVKTVKELFAKIPAAALYITLTNTKTLKFLMDNFDCYINERVPIGYNNGFQYHLVIRNVTDNRARPLISKRMSSNKDNIRKAILKIQKKYKRKTDIVDEILDELE